MLRRFLPAVLLVLASPFALAADRIVHLNQSAIDVPGVASALHLMLERTQSTPKQVTLAFAIPAKERYCARHDTKTVYGPDASCGTGTRLEYDCREESICRDVRNTCRDADGNYTGSQGPSGMCDFNGTHRVCDRYQRCGNFPVPYDLSCDHPVRYCAEYAVRDIVKRETVTVKFVRLDRLKAGETQRMTLDLAVEDIGGFGARIGRAELKNHDLPASYRIKDRYDGDFRVSRSLGAWIFDR